ncbi:MAG: hypothetical protein DRM99_05610 [Thermoplasmata archaeon]|nr:MAG: hypothetical protein DRM99_05610 [Thermoplasmata archaeon]
MAGINLIENKNTQIAKNLWIAGGYYVDFDLFNQFRIIGPNNHLYCGLVDIPRHRIKIKQVKAENAHLEIRGEFLSNNINFYYPVMEDIRTLRELIGVCKGGEKPFLQLRYKFLGRSFPRIIKRIIKKTPEKETQLLFKRTYQEGKYFYQTSFIFPSFVKVEKINLPLKGYRLTAKNKKNIPFLIKSKTNEIHRKKLGKFFEDQNINWKVFGKRKKEVKYFLWRTEKEIKHLVSWGKTSGDRYGTIFPRDWMESADLGEKDLTPEIISYIYEASLKNVNKKGEGWHEEVVGEYKYEHQISGQDIYDRKMIDIEPHYFLKLENLPFTFLNKKANKEKLKRIALYILNKARKDKFIIFKKIPRIIPYFIHLHPGEKEQKYYFVGNWRDSGWGFKKIGKIIAPFDVNCVFYPVALRKIEKYWREIGLNKNQIKDIDKLIKKWNKKKEFYQFKNKDGTKAFAICAYKKEENTKKFELMKVNHLDESYLFFYNKGNQDEIRSFCRRLLSPEYFYTSSGPMLIAKNNQYGYTTEEYHGLVIWTKQVAFTVLGLKKHFEVSIVNKWDKEVQKLIKKTILKICEDMIRTFSCLNAVPEVHIDKGGEPEFFSLWNMSEVQLWSAVGARAIFKTYHEILTNQIYKEI